MAPLGSGGGDSGGGGRVAGRLAVASPSSSPTAPPASVAVGQDDRRSEHARTVARRRPEDKRVSRRQGQTG